MKLSNAIKKLKKAGFEITGNIGSYIATKEGSEIRFFENGLGTDSCSKFTYSSETSCAPTYSLGLRQAISFC